MSQQRQCHQRAANDPCAAGDVTGQRLQVEVDVALLEALLRDRQLTADRIRPCNPQSAAALRHLLLNCLQLRTRRHS